VTNGFKVLAESLIIHKIQYIVINHINLFVFDDEIEMLPGAALAPKK
jgi:hypothetical protein